MFVHCRRTRVAAHNKAGLHAADGGSREPRGACWSIGVGLFILGSGHINGIQLQLEGHFLWPRRRLGSEVHCGEDTSQQVRVRLPVDAAWPGAHHVVTLCLDRGISDGSQALGVLRGAQCEHNDLEGEG